MCLHGFMDTWRTWDLVLPALERRHDVLAVTLAGHAGGPPIEGEVTAWLLADAVEQAMDAARTVVPVELLAHLTRGVAACDGAPALVDHALREGWPLDAGAIACPVRIVWGTDDRLLPWPSAAARFRNDGFPRADWVVLDGVGHCPQLDVPLEAAQLILGFTAP